MMGFGPGRCHSGVFRHAPTLEHSSALGAASSPAAIIRSKGVNRIAAWGRAQAQK